MAEQDIFEVWNPIDGTPDILNLKSLSDDLEKISIELKCDDESKPGLKITFKQPMLYRNIYYQYRLSVWESNPELEQHTLFTIKNSDTLEYMHELNNNVYKDRPFVHYAIYTGHDCIDVISDIEPEVEWLE